MTNTMTYSLQARGLQCIRNDMVLFSALDLQLQCGDLLQIEGSNGSGKTSLLRILSGLSTPNEGGIYWNDRNIREYQYEYLRNISYVGHQNGIKAELSAMENLELAGRLSDSHSETTPQQALQRFGLLGYEDIPVRKLSAGQRRRIALARLLISAAKLWILDEPFTSLDDDGKQLIKQMLETHIERQGMIILATHERLEISESRIRRVKLDNGAAFV